MQTNWQAHLRSAGPAGAHHTTYSEGQESGLIGQEAGHSIADIETKQNTMYADMTTTTNYSITSEFQGMTIHKT